MLAQWISNFRSRRGAAVEMAIVIPVFLSVAFGSIEFGRGMLVSKMVTSAAHEGAHMATQEGTTNEDVTAAIQAYMNSALGLAAQSVTVTIVTISADGNCDSDNQIANCRPGDKIRVKVQVPFDQMALIPGNYLVSKTVTGESAIRYE